MTPQLDILQQCRREADEIQWQRFDALLNPRLPKGSQEAFTAVILEHCKPKTVAAQNNLHLNGGGMKQLKHDAIALALRETDSITKAAAKLKVNRGVVYDYFRRKVALGVLSLFVLSLVSGIRSDAANVCIRDGGTGDGTAWNNALDDLPATLVRGNTYFIADGSYAAYSFDDAQSGTLVITIQKATASSHGTETGWSSTYGDGQAVFASALDILRPYYVIDGQARDEGDWFDGTAYGFKIAHNNSNTQIYCGDKRATNITLKYIHVESRNTSPATPKTSLYISDFDGIPRFANYIVQRCFFDKGNVQIFSRENDGMLIEYSAFADNTSDNLAHGEAISAYSGNDDFVFRYCEFRSIVGTAVFAFAGDNWQIYGNVIDSPAVGDGVVSGFTSGFTVNNTKFHHNTIYNSASSENGGLYYPAGTGNVAYNNLWIGNGTIFINGTHNYNGFSGANAYGEANAQTGLTTSIFVDYLTDDFRLESNTTAGTSLGSPYNVDVLGNTRTTWSRGAFEFSDSPPPSTGSTNRVFNLRVH